MPRSKRGGRDRAARDARYARTPCGRFRPLRIRAWFETPIITDGALPLDAVLYYVAHRQALGPQEFTIPGGLVQEGRSGASLPLARREEHGPSWYYACSFAQWPEIIAEGCEHWNKRIDESLCHLIDFQGRRGKIGIASAAFKSYHMPVYYRSARYADWYAIGDAAQIWNLLRFATHVGKKGSQGWGSVLRWEVEPTDDDWSVRGPEGRLMRPIPATDGSGILAGYRPSYWLPRNQALCWVPGRP